MDASPPAARTAFRRDLRAALHAARGAHTRKTTAARDRLFALWTDYCDSLHVPASLSHTTNPDLRLAYLLVFGLRYRQTGQTGHPVRATSVEDALLAVGAGISHLGAPDPRRDPHRPGYNHPLLVAFLASLRREDDPADRVYPANLTILRNLDATLDFNDPVDGPANRAVRDLAIAAFFWLMRPAEYLKPSTAGGRSQAFRLQDIAFTIRDRLVTATAGPCNDEDIAHISYATLTFSDQKNAVRGEQVGHRPSGDPLLCPCRALARLVLHLRQHHAPSDTPICAYFDPAGRISYVPPDWITNGLRHAARALQPRTGIPPDKISARSLRPGGATALLCAGVDPNHIQLLGRWKSDAMLRYLRVAAASRHTNYAGLMLRHGTYTFTPARPVAPHDPLLPRKAPAAVVAPLRRHR